MNTLWYVYARIDDKWQYTGCTHCVEPTREKVVDVFLSTSLFPNLHKATSIVPVTQAEYRAYLDTTGRFLHDSLCGGIYYLDYLVSVLPDLITKGDTMNTIDHVASSGSIHKPHVIDLTGNVEYYTTKGACANCHTQYTFVVAKGKKAPDSPATAHECMNCGVKEVIRAE